jgi:hypothetical protein
VTATTPDPVAIFAHPDELPWRVDALARHAISQQRAPLVLHGTGQPWLRDRASGCLLPVAEPVARSLLGLVARHTGGRLWLLLPDSCPRPPHGDPWPSWAQGAVRYWQRTAGRMPSRMRAGQWHEWRMSADVLAMGDMKADRRAGCIQ